ncbi:MAG: hypothetical protein Q9163_004069 [Psora crenata]
MRRTSHLTGQLKPSRRLLTISTRLSATRPFSPGPAPPRLPEEDQRIYEQLQKASTGAFTTPKTTVVINQSPVSSSPKIGERAHVPLQINQSPHTETASVISPEQKLENVNAKVVARGDGEELHPDVRRGSKPEFEGDRNPKTGEMGGPKNEPLRWGGEVDWSYNGRVTDF